jgi:hypothetical protein
MMIRRAVIVAVAEGDISGVFEGRTLAARVVTTAREIGRATSSRPQNRATERSGE